jgi:hypothetical protein
VTQSLMTMPSPREDIKLGNIGARWEEKLETAQPYSVPEGPTPAIQLMPMPEGPSSASPEFPTTAEDGTVPSHPGKHRVIAPWLSTTPRLDDAICEKRNATETDAALKRLLRIAEDESGNFHSAPESSSESPNENFDTCVPELPRPTSGLESKEEIANVDTPPHPAETYVASEADIGTKVNSHAAPDSETGKCKGDYGNNERDLCPRANPPIVEDEIASTENHLERSWIRAVSLVPDTPNGVLEGFKQSDVAVPLGAAEKAAPSSSLPPFLQHQLCVFGPQVGGRSQTYRVERKCPPLLRPSALRCAEAVATPRRRPASPLHG